jgi:hypothetical protein
MYSSGHFLRYFCCWLLLLSLFAGLATVSDASSPTTVFMSECGLTAKGYFTYMYSDSDYKPVNSLQGQTLNLYFTKEAEHKILWDSDSANYITNASSETVTGFLSQYNFKIDAGQYVAVYQPHRTSGNYNRDAWAYYMVTISDNDIDTDLLYRSDRSNTFIILISAGIVILIISTLFKFIRREL